MRVSLNWLRKFIDFDLDAEQLAAALTMLGLEVEEIEHLGEAFNKVVVGQLLSVDRHPDADKLSFCRVSTGTEELEIVCGAKNISPGDLVPVALVGAELPNGMKIKRSKIRGVESNGMLCSAQELELGVDHSGIYLLDKGAKLGSGFAEYLHLEDTVFEIGLTPNRGDCLSILGIAREVAAYCNVALKIPTITFEENGPEVNQLASVEIKNPELCPRYAARVIQGITIKESPVWLKAALKASGLRPINNVVDVTNYVLMELGHPLHAFDYDLIREKRIVVQLAKDGEKFYTLDGEERNLNAENLLICDGQGAVALAGVMGGKNSEVNEKTVSLLIESAYFKPENIHQTSKKLNLDTEAAHRFARGSDIEGLINALERTTQLILELAGGTVAKGILDVYPQEIQKRVVQLRPERVNRILGTEIGASEIGTLLERLHFKIGTENGVFMVEIPTFRPDITREIDLIEEVARLYGYNNISSRPLSGSFTHALADHHKQIELARETVLHFGLDEIITYSFIDPLLLNQLNLPSEHPLKSFLPLANPLTEKQGVMRPSLLPLLLSTMRHNEFQQNRQVKIFELGKIFQPLADEKLPDEPHYLSGIISGQRENDALYQDTRKVDFYDLKAIVEAVCTALKVPPVMFVAEVSEPYYHPSIHASVRVNGKKVGNIGKLHPTVQSNFELSEDVFIFELNLDLLLNLPTVPKKYLAFSRFPAVNLDLAMLVQEEIKAQEIIKIIKGNGGKILEKVDLFDVYRGKQIKEGFKSLAFSLRFRSTSGTLTDDDVFKRYGKIVEELEKRSGAEVRK